MKMMQFFFFQAEDGIRAADVTGVQTCALPISAAGRVREALAAAGDAFAAAGVDSPRLDAEVLLAEATGWDRAHLAAEPEAPVDAAAARRFGEMVRRRIRREPVAYIVGRKGFRRLELSVGRRALVPRPET